MNRESLFSMPEGTLFDRKARLYVVENATHLDHQDHLRDFVRHVVALANFARLSGRHACLVFGVGDKAHEGGVVPAHGIGILDHSAATSDQVSWPRGDNTAFQHYWAEHVNNPYDRVIREYVGPRSKPAAKGAKWESQLRYSLDYEKNGEAALALLRIYPSKTSSPFFAEKHRSLGLDARYFVRVNDNSIALGETEAEETLTCWTNQPYLPPSVWKDYLNSLRDDVGVTRPHDPSEPDRYQRIYVESLDKRETYEFEELWARLASSNSPSSQFVVFMGEPGTGKTWRLKRSLYDQAGVALTELENDDAMLEPQAWIPVYVPVSNYEGQRDFETVVADAIDRRLALGGRRSEQLDARLLTARQLRFLVAIDAVDEIPERSVESSARQIDAFANHHTATNNAITSREARLPSRWSSISSAHRVRPLSEAQVRSYLLSRFSEDHPDSSHLRLLQEELRSMLCIPRLLQAFSVYLEEDPRPNAGMAVRRILETIWELEKQLWYGGPGGIANHRSTLEAYATSCVEHQTIGFYRDEVEDHQLSEAQIVWYVNAGFLKLSGDWPQQICFMHLEYLDSLNAQTLLMVESRPSTKHTELRDRMKKALAASPDRLGRTARYLLNRTEGDISQSPWADWIRAISDPVGQLRVISERRNSKFDDTTLLGEAIASIDEDLIVQEPASSYWLGELLQDRNAQVIACVLEVIDDRHLVLAMEEVIALLVKSDQQALQHLALKRLLHTGLAYDHPEVRDLVVRWLRDHQNGGAVEDALALIGDFRLTWALDAVYEVAKSDLPYPPEVRDQARQVLSLLEDPRSTEFPSTVVQADQPLDTERVVDEARPQDFLTSLTELPSAAADAETVGSATMEEQ